MVVFAQPALQVPDEQLPMHAPSNNDRGGLMERTLLGDSKPLLAKALISGPLFPLSISGGSGVG